MRAVLLVLAVLATGCASAPALSASPLLVEPGADVGSAYLPALAVRDDGGLDVHAVGVPGATVRITDAFHVTNRGSAPLLVALASETPDPSWRVGLGSRQDGEALLAPGETRVGQLILSLPEAGAVVFQTGFDVRVLVKG